MPYVDPNSGLAPQPGGLVVGGAESQVGADHERMQEVLAVQAANPPTSGTEQEIQRQAQVAVNQAEAKQGTEDSEPPAEAERPDLAE